MGRANGEQGCSQHCHLGSAPSLLVWHLRAQGNEPGQGADLLQICADRGEVMLCCMAVEQAAALQEMAGGSLSVFQPMGRVLA